MQKIVVLTGAGISAESGISTFRDANGLWENHDIMEVASPQGWEANPELVLRFYNDRRRQLNTVEPNAAHYYLKELEKHYQVVIITQNVDDLHERAGSSHVIHLHGELRKVRSVKNEKLIYDWTEDVRLGDTAEDGGQLRPHIVWFGEMVPNIEIAAAEIPDAGMMLIIGTSLQVYPAAGLKDLMDYGKPIYYIDPNATQSGNTNIKVISKKATEGVKDLELF